MESEIEKCARLIIKSETTEGISNQVSRRLFREKENYKYLGILEANTIKQTDEKKWERSTSEEPEDLLKPNSAIDIESKE